VQLHVERGSRASEVKCGSHVLAQHEFERDSRVLTLRRAAHPSATTAFERQRHILKQEHECRI